MKTLRFVDIDETVFNTTAQIIIRNTNGIAIKKLSNSEWNEYDKVKVDNKQEFADFCEFTNSSLFYKTSKPIKQMIEKLKQWSNEMRTHLEHYDDKVVFVTARGDFDDRELFLDKFRENLIAIDDHEHFYISRTGNLTNDVLLNGIRLSVSQRKKIVFLKYIMDLAPDVVEFYDDYEQNLKDFLALKKELPKHTFFAYKVSKDKIEPYN